MYWTGQWEGAQTYSIPMTPLHATSPYRMLELKGEMVGLEHLEYHYFDDIISDMKLTPVLSH